MGPLDQKHRNELHASGIDDETIEQAGIHSAADAEIATILGWQPRAYLWGRGMVFPFDLDGEEASYARVKLDYPRHGRCNRFVKYESPRQTPNRVYFPPGLTAAANDVAKPFFITEGEKKALSAAQRGFLCLGLVGVWGFATRRPRRTTGKATGPRVLLADFDRVRWNRRRVYIMFDSDAAEKPDVRKAERELAALLTARGADVRIVRLPKLGDGKTGLDDFIVYHGARAVAKLQALLDDAAAASDGHEDDKSPAHTAPMILADRYIAIRFIRAGVPIAGHWRDELWVWNGYCYRPVTEGDFEKQILVWLDSEVDIARPRLAREVAECVGARLLITADREQPLWLGPKGKGPHQPGDWIVVPNGILDIPAVLAGREEALRPHTPLWFTGNSLPCAYHLSADCPHFRAFLAEALEGDPERIGLLQQWFGYNLVPDTTFHKFMMLVGDGANGKTVVLLVLEALLGADNVSHVGLETFGHRFGLWPTIGKLANIVPEVGELARTDEGVFKAFVDGSPLTIDRKILAPVKGRPTARVTIATNTMPRWLDRSEGVWRRQIAMPFRVRVPEERQDRHLAKRIIATELSGVLNWALGGLYSLWRDQQFRPAQVCSDLGSQHRLESNPAKVFLTTECVDAPGEPVRSDALYAAYSNWCRNRGYRPLGDAQFGHEIERAFPNSKRAKRRVGGREVYHRVGISCPLAAEAGAVSANGDYFPYRR